MVRVSISLPEDLYMRVKFEAQKRGMAVASYIRFVLEASLRKNI